MKGIFFTLSMVFASWALLVSGETMETLKETVSVLVRQMMLDKLYIEERTRSEGDSGIKLVRRTNTGTKIYHGPTHTGRRFASMHDHANNIRTVGMGEFIGVLNGVEFRTRHNDYSLKAAHSTSSDYHVTEEIPFPDVPLEVLAKTNITEQIEEMREWFKAWANQDHSKRDYRKYFVPIVSYLEGAWTHSGRDIEESFDSDRHHLDAKSWFDLQEKIRFTSRTGSKDLKENYAFLPTTIEDLENGVPKFSQWNYRILCHRLSRDIPLNRFRLIDDFSARMANEETFEQHAQTRAARFQLNPFDKNEWPEDEAYQRYGLLDKIMEEIPGKDNYQGDLQDNAFGMTTKHYLKNADNSYKELNAAKYHRLFRVVKPDAMGEALRFRGFNDENLFMAMTEQAKVAESKVTHCEGESCTDYSQKWSYAIPMEIIYMTPLSKWNPYKLTYKGRSGTSEGKLSGTGKENDPFDGLNSKTFFQTPYTLFTGGLTDSDTADTAPASVYVKDPDGNVKRVVASGTRIMLPDIAGISGRLRQRWPIMPVHGEGSSVWKELAALRDAVMEMSRFRRFYRDPPVANTGGSGGNGEEVPVQGPVEFHTGDSAKKGVGIHSHTFILSPEKIDKISNCRTSVEVETNGKEGHTHQLRIRKFRCGKESVMYLAIRCDGERRCRDRHPRRVYHPAGQILIDL